MDRRLIWFIALVVFPFLQNKVLSWSPLQIVNGTNAEEGEFPYMVQLYDWNSAFVCGGSIIGSEWILTAGHCGGIVKSIVYGTNKLYNYSKDSSIRVKKWYEHPNFTFTQFLIPLYDVGILQLEASIPFGETAQPIQLPEANESVPFHVQGVLSGWGVNVTGGNEMLDLQKINRQLLTDEECYTKINNFSGVNSFIPIHHLCSDDYYDGECNGDSGSPLVINGTQYGIVSWSYKPCGIVPGAYSRISNPEYRDWIRKITNI